MIDTLLNASPFIVIAVIAVWMILHPVSHKLPPQLKGRDDKPEGRDW